MMIVDMLLKPADTYWKKQHRAEEIRRRKAEADAQYFQQTCEQQEKDIALLSERDIKQARALEVMGRELEQMRKAKEEYLEYAKRQEREMDLLREALRSEREAKAAFRNSAMLWESLKTRDARTAEEAPGDREENTRGETAGEEPPAAGTSSGPAGHLPRARGRQAADEAEIARTA